MYVSTLIKLSDKKRHDHSKGYYRYERRFESSRNWTNLKSRLIGEFKFSKQNV